MTVVEWINDFIRKIYHDIVVVSLNFCIMNKRMILYGYAIISIHIHMVLQSKDEKLSELIRAFKKFTAKTILDKIQVENESRKNGKKATETHQRN